MKKFAILPLAFLMAVVTFSSCTKDVADRLPGTWDVSSKFEITSTDNSAATNVTFTSSITFKEDGTFSATSPDDADLSTGTWSSTDTHVTLDGTAYEIITNKSSEQVWENVTTETGGGVTVTSKLTVTLTN